MFVPFKQGEPAFAIAEMEVYEMLCWPGVEQDRDHHKRHKRRHSSRSRERRGHQKGSMYILATPMLLLEEDTEEAEDMIAEREPSTRTG